MRTRNPISIVIILLALVWPATSWADDFDRRGAYVGVNGAYGIDLLSDQLSAALGAGANNVVSFENSWGLNARVGYRALSWFALEVEYEWMKGIGVSLPVVGNIGTYKPNTITGNAKFIIPFWRAQPYILAGGGVSIWTLESPLSGFLTSTTSTGFGFRAGAGLDMYLSKNWVLNAEGTAVLNTSEFQVNLGPTLDKLYYFSVSAGLAYRF